VLKVQHLKPFNGYVRPKTTDPLIAVRPIKRCYIASERQDHEFAELLFHFLQLYCVRYSFPAAAKSNKHTVLWNTLKTHKITQKKMKNNSNKSAK